MYLASNFFVLLFAVVFAWMGKREYALIVFSLNLIIAILLFNHHVTDAIGLSL